MTHLRKMMLEELQRRNYAETTINSYLRSVEEGIRNSGSTPTSIAWFLPVDYLPIAGVGSNHAMHSFFPSRCLAASSAASSLPLSSAPSMKIDFVSREA